MRNDTYGMYMLYTPPTSHIDPVLGGKARAAKARRDKWGRMLPNNGELNPPTDHGLIGGLTRARTAQRNAQGRFQ